MINEIVVPQFIKMLGNLSAILDKAAKHAEEKKFDIEVLLRSRLAPDQFDLIFQVQVACDTAKLGIARLAGKEKDAPSYPDTEKTLAEVKARIDKTVAYLKTFKAKDFAGADERRISQPRWEGKSLSGEQFLHQHVIPNLYFHVTTAYAILRHNGVNIGKKDYLGQLPYKQ